ncbi:MAG: MFS transporter, partial [Nocardiopsaceae bacterium]|nr:MFS transporter [Nocardiopsaceae bacterium]
PSPPKLDPVGVVLVSAALLLLLYPLVEGRQLGWPAWTFVSMACSLPVLAGFVGYERIKARRDGSPLVQLRLFAQRSFSIGIAIAMTFFLGVTSFALILTLFLQIGLGFSALHAGLTFLPFSAGVLVASAAAARLAPRFGRGVTMTGALVMAAGMVGLILIVRNYGHAVTTAELLPGLIVAGLGMGTVLAPLADILLAGVRKEDAGSASGVFNTSIQLGASIGVAVIGVIFFGLLGTQSGPAATAVTPQLRSTLATEGLPPAATERVVTAFRACLHDRLVAADPTATPASCRLKAGDGNAGQTATGLPASAKHAIAGIGKEAAGIDFAATLERTLFFQVGVFVISFLLMLALPRTRRARLAGERAEEAAHGDPVARHAKPAPPVLTHATDHE